jgi:Putative MetA-pathway of phenol degradation
MSRTASGGFPSLPRHEESYAHAIAALRGLVACVVCAFVLVKVAGAQEIEPRSYSNAPVGVNFLIAGFGYTRGGFPTDSGLPITDPHLETSNTVFAYARSLDLWGMSGKFDAIVPYTWLHGTAVYAGQPVERVVNGFGNPLFRLSINLYGAPAMTLKEFSGYQQDLIVGASLQVSPPWGQYDDQRIVNIGTNSWRFKPEIGVSKALGAWTLEGTAAVTLFTENNDFYGGNRRAQDPLYSIQGHAIYSFSNGVWASADATWFAGGRTTLNDVLSNDLQQNSRVGTTLALPLNRYNSIKFALSSGVSARTGNSFDLIAVAWQHRWGGGL